MSALQLVVNSLPWQHHLIVHLLILLKQGIYMYGHVMQIHMRVSSVMVFALSFSQSTIPIISMLMRMVI